MRSLALCVSLLLTSAVLGDARIENLNATGAGHLVSVKFHLAEGFRDGKLQQTLQSGLPTTLTYEIEIFRDRPNWFDESVDRARIEVISTFNSVTREYLLNYRRDRRLVRSEVFTDLAMLERAMTHIDEPNLFDIGDRRPYKLKVRAKANLLRGYLLYVIPREVATRWRETRIAGPSGR